MNAFSPKRFPRLAAHVLGCGLLLAPLAAPAQTKAPAAPIKAKEPRSAEALLAERLAIRDSLATGEFESARVLADGAVRARSAARRQRSEPTAHDRWAEYYMALLALQPTEPSLAAERARRVVAKLTDEISRLPAGERSRLWILVAQIQEQLIGDGLAALAAYRQAEEMGAPAEAEVVRGRTEALKRRLGIAH